MKCDFGTTKQNGIRFAISVLTTFVNIGIYYAICVPVVYDETRYFLMYSYAVSVIFASVFGIFIFLITMLFNARYEYIFVGNVVQLSCMTIPFGGHYYEITFEVVGTTICYSFLWLIPIIVLFASRRINEYRKIHKIQYEHLTIA